MGCKNKVIVHTINKQKELMSRQKMSHEHNEKPKSPIGSTTCYASKLYKMHKLHQRYTLMYVYIHKRYTYCLYKKQTKKRQVTNLV